MEVGAVVGVVVGTAVGEVEYVLAEEAFVVGGVQDQEDTASVVKEEVYRTRCIYHHQAQGVEALPVAAREGTSGEQVLLHLGVLGMVVGRAGQNNCQGGVAAVFAVDDACTDLERDSVDEEAVPAVEREEEDPGSLLVPSPGSTCQQLEKVVGGE